MGDDGVGRLGPGRGRPTVGSPALYFIYSFVGVVA